MNKPTQEEYAAYNQACDYFNTQLFDGHLPSCLITLQRHRGARGYFWERGFAARTNYTLRTDNIALNPDTFAGRSDKEILSTLVHELCHLKEAHFGKPGRGGYHNKAWAREMLRIGLHPFEFDKQGRMTGKMTGQRVTHQIVPGGLFDVVADRLLATGFCLRWQSAVSKALNDTTTGTIMVVEQKRNKVKYTCPECGQNVWAKPQARLICGHCTDTRDLKKYIPLMWITESRP